MGLGEETVSTSSTVLPRNSEMAENHKLTSQK